MRRLLHAALMAALIPMAACDAGSSTAPEDPAVTQPLQLALLSPADGLVVRQNDPTIGCPAHPHRGYGFELELDWADVEHPSEIEGYELRVKQRTARYAMIDRVVETSGYTFRACNGFVTDRNLDGWEWRVRVHRADGAVGPWSVRGFSFGPCRLDDGDPCTAPS